MKVKVNVAMFISALVELEFNDVPEGTRVTTKLLSSKPVFTSTAALLSEDHKPVAESMHQEVGGIAVHTLLKHQLKLLDESMTESNAIEFAEPTTVLKS